MELLASLLVVAATFTPANVYAADGFDVLVIEGGQKGDEFTFLQSTTTFGKKSVIFSATLINVKRPTLQRVSVVEVKLYNTTDGSQFELITTLELQPVNGGSDVIELKFSDSVKRENKVKVVIAATR